MADPSLGPARVSISKPTAAVRSLALARCGLGVLLKNGLMGVHDQNGCPSKIIIPVKLSNLVRYKKVRTVCVAIPDRRMTFGASRFIADTRRLAVRYQ